MALEVVAAALVALAAVSALAMRELSHRRERAGLRAELAAAQAKITERSGLAAVGEMVSGLAQELKTPLQEVLGNTELMLATTLARSGTSQQSAEDLREIRDGVERAAGIVRNLVAFTETVSLSCRWHDVADIVDRAVAASRHDLEASGARLERPPAERLPMVYVDGRQLEKVFALLLARPAQTGSRSHAPVTITIAIDRVAAPEDHVVFTIADDAPAAAEEPHAPVIGAARRVIEAHGGTLIVSSARGSGTRITIGLPIAAASTAARSSQEKTRSWTESSISSTSIVKSISTS